MSDMELGVIEGEKLYNPKDVVWVKLSGMWWPAEVQDQATLDPEVTEGLKKPPLCVVQFLLEESYLHIKSLDQIYHYNCKKKMEFLKLGFKKYSRNKNEKNVAIWPDVIQEAERRTGGNPDIINDPDIVPVIEKQETPSNKPGPSGQRLSLPTGIRRGQGSRRSLPTNFRRSSLNGAVSKSLSSVDDDNTSDGGGRCERNIVRYMNIARTAPVDVDEIQVTPMQYDCVRCDFKTIDLERYLLHLKFKHFQFRLPPPRPRLAITGPSKPKKEKKRKEESASPIVKKKKKKSVVTNEEQTPKLKKKKSPAPPSALEVSQECEQILKDWDDEDDEMKEGDKTSHSEDMIVDENTTSQAIEKSDICLVLNDKDGPLNDTKEPVSKNVEAPAPLPKSSSCFDFDDEEPARPELQTLKFGQKLPRVISPEKSKSSATDSLSDVCKLESFLKEVSVPELPSIPSSLKAAKGGNKLLSSHKTESEKKPSDTEEVSLSGFDNQSVEDKKIVVLNDGEIKSEEKHFLVEGPLQQSKKRKGSGLTEGAEDGSAGKKPKCNDDEVPSKLDCVKIIDDVHGDEVDKPPEMRILELENEVLDKPEEVAAITVEPGHSKVMESLFESVKMEIPLRSKSTISLDELDEVAAITVEPNDSKVMESPSESVNMEIPLRSKSTISELDKQSLIDTLTYSPSSVDADFSQKKKKRSKDLKRLDEEAISEDIVSELDTQSLIDTLTVSPTPVDWSTPCKKKFKKDHFRKSPKSPRIESGKTPDTSRLQKDFRDVSTNECGSPKSRSRSTKSRSSSYSPAKHSKVVPGHEAKLEEESPKLRNLRHLHGKGNHDRSCKSQPTATGDAIKLLDVKSSPSTPKSKKKRLDKSGKSSKQTNKKAFPGKTIESVSSASVKKADEETPKITIKPDDAGVAAAETTRVIKYPLDSVTNQNETVIGAEKKKPCADIDPSESSLENRPQKDIENVTVMSSRLRSKSGSGNDCSPSSKHSTPHSPGSLVGIKKRDVPVAAKSNEDAILKEIAKSDTKSKARSNNQSASGLTLSELSKSDEVFQKSSENAKIALEKNEFLEVSKLMPKEMENERPKRLVDDDCLTSSIDEKTKENSDISPRSRSLKVDQQATVDEPKKKSSRILGHAHKEKSRKSVPKVSDSTKCEKEELAKGSDIATLKKEEHHRQTSRDKPRSLKTGDKRLRGSYVPSDKSPSKTSIPTKSNDTGHSKSKRASRSDDRQLVKLESISSPTTLDITKDLRSKVSTPKEHCKTKHSSESVNSRVEPKEHIPSPSKSNFSPTAVAKHKGTIGVLDDGRNSKSKQSSQSSERHSETKDRITSSPRKSIHAKPVVAKGKGKSEAGGEKEHNKSRRSSHSSGRHTEVKECISSPNKSIHTTSTDTKDKRKSTTTPMDAKDKRKSEARIDKGHFKRSSHSHDSKGEMLELSSIPSKRISKDRSKTGTSDASSDERLARDKLSIPSHISHVESSKEDVVHTDVTIPGTIENRRLSRSRRQSSPQINRIKTQESNLSPSDTPEAGKIEGFSEGTTSSLVDDKDHLRTVRKQHSLDIQVGTLECSKSLTAQVGKDILPGAGIPSLSDNDLPRREHSSPSQHTQVLVTSISPCNVVEKNDELPEVATPSFSEHSRNKRALRSQDRVQAHESSLSTVKSKSTNAEVFKDKRLTEAATLGLDSDKEHSRSKRALRSQDTESKSLEPSSVPHKSIASSATVDNNEGLTDAAMLGLDDDEAHSTSKHELRSQDTRSRSHEPSSVPSKSSPISATGGKNEVLTKAATACLDDDKEQSRSRRALRSQVTESKSQEPSSVPSKSIATSATIGKNEGLSETTMLSLNDDKEHSTGKHAMRSQDTGSRSHEPGSLPSESIPTSTTVSKDGGLTEATTPGLDDYKEHSRIKLASDSQEQSSVTSKCTPTSATVGQNDGLTEATTIGLGDDKEYSRSKHALLSQDTESKSQEPSSMPSKSVPTSATFCQNEEFSEAATQDMGDDKEHSTNKRALRSQDSRVQTHQSSLHQTSTEIGKNEVDFEAETPSLSDNKELYKSKCASRAQHVLVLESSLSASKNTSNSAEVSKRSLRSQDFHSKTVEFSWNNSENIPAIAEVDKCRGLSEAAALDLGDDKDLSKKEFSLISSGNQVLEPSFSPSKSISATADIGRTEERSESINLDDDKERARNDPLLFSSGSRNQSEECFPKHTTADDPKDGVHSETPILPARGGKGHAKRRHPSHSQDNDEKQDFIVSPVKNTTPLIPSFLSETASLTACEDVGFLENKSLPSSGESHVESISSFIKDSPDTPSTVMEEGPPGTTEKLSDSKVNLVEIVKFDSSHTETVEGDGSTKSGTSNNGEFDRTRNTTNTPDVVGPSAGFVICTDEMRFPKGELSDLQDNQINTTEVNSGVAIEDVGSKSKKASCTSDDLGVQDKIITSSKSGKSTKIETNSRNVVNRADDVSSCVKPVNSPGVATLDARVLSNETPLVIASKHGSSHEAKQEKDPTSINEDECLHEDNVLPTDLPRSNKTERRVASSDATPAKRSRRISNRDVKIASDKDYKTTKEAKRGLDATDDHLNKEMLAPDEATPLRRSKRSSSQDIKNIPDKEASKASVLPVLSCKVNEGRKETKTILGKCKQEKLLGSNVAIPSRRTKRSVSRDQKQNSDSSSVEGTFKESELTVDDKLLSESKIGLSKSVPLDDKAASLSYVVPSKIAMSADQAGMEQNMPPDLPLSKVPALVTTSDVFKKSVEEPDKALAVPHAPTIASPLTHNDEKEMIISSTAESRTERPASTPGHAIVVDTTCAPESTVQSPSSAVYKIENSSTPSTEEQPSMTLRGSPKVNTPSSPGFNKDNSILTPLAISRDIVSCESPNKGSTSNQKPISTDGKEVPPTSSGSKTILKQNEMKTLVEYPTSLESKLSSQAVRILPSNESMVLKDDLIFPADDRSNNPDVQLGAQVESVVGKVVVLPPSESIAVGSLKKSSQKEGYFGGIKSTPSSYCKNLEIESNLSKPEAIETKGTISNYEKTITQSKLVSSSIFLEATKSSKVQKNVETKIVEPPQTTVVTARASRWDNPFPTRKSDSRPSTPTHSLLASPTKMVLSPVSKVKVEIKSGLGRSCFKSPPLEVKCDSLDAKSIEPDDVKAQPKQVVPKNVNVETSLPKANLEAENEFDDELSALRAEIASYSESKLKAYLPKPDPTDVIKKADSLKVETAKVHTHSSELKTDDIKEVIENKLPSIGQPEVCSKQQILDLGNALVFNIPLESIPLPGPPKPPPVKFKETPPPAPKIPGLSEAALLASLLKGDEDDVPTHQAKVASVKKEIAKPLPPVAKNEHCSSKSVVYEKQSDSNSGFSNTKSNLLRPVVPCLPQVPKVISSIPLPLSEPSISSSQPDAVSGTSAKQLAPIVIPVEPPKVNLKNQVPIKPCSEETPTSRVEVLEVERSPSQVGLVGGIDPSKLLNINDIPFVFAEDLIEEGLMPSEASSMDSPIVTTNMDSLNALTESIPANVANKKNVVSSTAIDSEETFAIEDLVEEVVEEEPATDATLSGDVIDSNFTIVESSEKKVYEARQVRQYFIEVYDDSDPDFEYNCSLPLAPFGKTAIGQTIVEQAPPAKKLAKVVPIQPKRMTAEPKLVNFSSSGKLVSGVSNVGSSQQIIRVQTIKSSKSTKSITAADLERQNVPVSSGNLSEVPKVNKEPLKLRMVKDAKTGATKFMVKPHMVQNLSKSACQQLIMNQQLKNVVKSPASVVASTTLATKNPSLIHINKNPVVSPKLLSRGASPSILSQRKPVRHVAPSQRAASIPIQRPGRSKTAPEMLVGNSNVRLPIDHSGLILTNNSLLPESSTTNQVLLSGSSNQLLLSSSSNQQSGSKYVSFLMNKPPEPKKAGKDLLEQALTGLDVQNDDVPSMMPTATVVYGVLTDPLQQRPIMTTAVQPTQVILSHDQLLSFQTPDDQSSTVSNSETNR